jgi:uncharacterized membrane protein YhaH (DUF805 family)
MHRLKRLFSMTGRASRLEFWRLLLKQQLALVAVWCLTILATMAGGWLGLAPFLLLAPVLAFGVCIYARRLHDRGRSAWWLVLFALGPYLLMMAAGLVIDLLGGPLSAVISLPMALGAVVLAIWGWIELGFRRGTRGPNAFGADPA